MVQEVLDYQGYGDCTEGWPLNSLEFSSLQKIVSSLCYPYKGVKVPFDSIVVRVKIFLRCWLENLKTLGYIFFFLSRLKKKHVLVLRMSFKMDALGNFCCYARTIHCLY